MKILYFAKLKQIIGKHEDNLKIESNKKICEIIDELMKKNNDYAKAFNQVENLQFAVNCEYVNKDFTVTNSDELAIFPPVTGG